MLLGWAARLKVLLQDVLLQMEFLLAAILLLFAVNTDTTLSMGWPELDVFDEGVGSDVLSDRIVAGLRQISIRPAHPAGGF